MAPIQLNLKRLVFLDEIKRMLLIAEQEYEKDGVVSPRHIHYSHLSFLGIDHSSAITMLNELKSRQIIYKFIENILDIDVYFELPHRNLIENIENDWRRLESFSPRLISLEDDIFRYRGNEWKMTRQNSLIIKAIYLLASEKDFSHSIISYKEIQDKIFTLTKKKRVIDQDQITTALNTGKAKRGIFVKYPEWISYNGIKIFTVVKGVGVEFRNPVI